MKVRQFRASDLDKIMQFKLESLDISFPGQEARTDLFMKKILDAEKGSVLVAEEKGEILGYVFLKKKRMNTGTYGTVHHIFVNSGHRRKGIATVLMNEAEQYFRRIGVNRIQSTITLGNAASVGMAKKLGYREKRIVMEKRLD